MNHSKLLGFATLALSCTLFAGVALAQSDKPNILMIMSDDVGITNISAYSRGMAGYRTQELSQDFGVSRRVDEGVRGKAEAQLVHEGGEAIELVHVRLGVHAKNGGDVAVDQEAGARLVAEEHELLDEAVGLAHAGILAAPLHGGGLSALGVDRDTRLRHLEIQRSSLQTAPAQERGELPHHLQVGP